MTQKSSPCTDKQCIESMQQLIDRLKQHINNLKDELDMAYIHIDKLLAAITIKQECTPILSPPHQNDRSNECNTDEYSNKSYSHHSLSISALLSSCGTADD